LYCGASVCAATARSQALRLMLAADFQQLSDTNSSVPLGFHILLPMLQLPAARVTAAAG
jgi:hypothetical protein